MNALVVNPWVTDFKLYDEWMHPSGLYFLMSFLRHNGCDVFYYNLLSRPADGKGKTDGTGQFPSRDHPKPALYKKIMRRYKIYGRPERDFEDYLLSIPRPDVVFVGGGMTYWVAGIKKTVDFLADMFPGVPCIAGGTTASLMPRVLRSVLGGRAHVYGGSLFDKASLAKSGIPILHAMDNLPKQASLLPALRLLASAPHGPVLTSLGCPLSCTYCASRTLFSDYCPRPPDTVAEEIKYLASRFGARHFAFYDDALLYRADEHLLPFLSALHASGISARFHVPNGMHVRWITSRVLDIMIKSGFSTLRLGYESGSVENSRHTAGKTTYGQLAEKISMIRGAGFTGGDIGVYVMAGLPGGIPGNVAAEIDSVADLGVRVKPVFLSPVPTTPLFRHYAKQFPEMETDPLWHNDSFFITRLPGWDAASVQDIIDRAKLHNAKVA